MTLTRTYTLIVHQDEDGRFWSNYEELPTCLSEGDTFEECVENAREALALWMEDVARRGEEPPEPNGASTLAQVAVEVNAGKAVVRSPIFATKHAPLP